MSDHYAVLGVARDASADQIRDAYRKLAREYHPDRNKAPGAEARFKEINAAHEVLSDPEKRKKYDMFGDSGPGLGGGPGGFSPGGFPPGFDPFGGGGRGRGGGVPDLGDLFEGLFGGGFGPMPGGMPGGARRSTRVPVHEVDLDLSLEEAFAGGPREIQVKIGRSKPISLSVVIPAGVLDGSRFIVRGGLNESGKKGDLAVTVRLKPHATFRLEGIHLHAPLAVTAWDAALGAEVRMPTLEGAVMLTLKPGTPSGRRIKLSGRGFVGENGERGDLYAEVRIMVPTSLTPQERELFEKLRQISTFKAAAP